MLQKDPIKQAADTVITGACTYSNYTQLPLNGSIDLTSLANDEILTLIITPYANGRKGEPVTMNYLRSNGPIQALAPKNVGPFNCDSFAVQASYASTGATYAMETPTPAVAFANLTTPPVLFARDSPAARSASVSIDEVSI